MSKKVLLPVLFISVFTVGTSFFAGAAGGYLGQRFADRGAIPEPAFTEVEIIDQESAIVKAVEKAKPAVVSIIITKNLPKYEEYLFNPFGDDPVFEDFSIPRRRQNGTEEQQVGAGSGFLVSADGIVITNRHVVDDESANYTVILNDGQKLSASVLGRDTILDIAVLKIKNAEKLPFLPLGDSDQVKVGQTTIAIGNSLGEFSNTVSSGIISGLSRDIVAGGSGGANASKLNDLLQTDASINLGNSGGPLLDIGGNVIGVNVAIADDAENIGFAIPINEVKTIITSVTEFGEIRRPYLGVRYVILTPDLIKENGLDTTHGALLINGSAGEAAVISNGPADKAGLKVGDVILTINGVKIDADHELQSQVQKYKVGDNVTLQILRDGKEQSIKVRLEKSPG